MTPISYFAYGSNMLRKRLEDRGVVLLDEGRPARITGYTLAFNKAGIDDSSKANLMVSPDAFSWGILFSVSEGTLPRLDLAEGVPLHYRQETVAVWTDDGDHSATTYLAHPAKVVPVPVPPWDWYLALILAGAKACAGFPEEWITELRRLGNPKATIVPTGSSREAVDQLAASGHHRWRDLLNFGSEVERRRDGTASKAKEIEEPT